MIGEKELNAQAFNEWMRRYIEDPERYNREFQSVEKFRAEGDSPSYGYDCAAYLEKLRNEILANY